MHINQPTLDYIRQHAADQPRQLALQGCKDPAVDLPFALEQIAGRQYAARKLPAYAATEGLVYPPHLSLEQCSSELAARYKARLVAALQPAPSTLLDMTGGLGVDFSFMAPSFGSAYYVEQQPHLCDLARHNLPLLGLPRAHVVCADGADYLRQSSCHFDWVYADPARRDQNGSRTYSIGDCTPNVLTLLDLFAEKADHVLLKLSPMLDWRKAVSDLGPHRVRQVHIVSVDNECKELLLLMGSAPSVACSYTVHCVNLLSDASEQHFVASPFNSFPPSPSVNPSLEPGETFLYEPNASIMKAGCFDELAAHYEVWPVAPNSHLFLSDRLVADFPGRKFRVVGISSMNKRELKTKLQHLSQANITVRNFPLSAADLRRRLKLADGGPTYLFATTLSDDRTHTLFICQQPTT